MPLDQAEYEEAADEADDHAAAEVQAVMNLLADQLRDADYVERCEELGSCGQVLTDVSEKYDSAQLVLDAIDAIVSDVAVQTGVAADTIKDQIKPSVKETKRQQVRDAFDENASENHRYTLDDGIGVDEYVEENLEGVLKLDNTDHMSDPRMVFKFSDGTSVEFKDNDQRNPEAFLEEVSVAAPGKVVEKIASRQAMDDIDGFDPSDDLDMEQYGEYSLGPERRKWGLDWKPVIADLEDEFGMEYTPVNGPCSNAWSRINEKIDGMDAARDKQSVVDANRDAVHYNEKHDEIWVPAAIINAACEKFSVGPEELVYEIHERGVTSNQMSGVGCSYPETGVTPATRFWRLDATHDDVNEPNRTIDEIDTERTVFATDDDGGVSNMDDSEEGDN